MAANTKAQVQALIDSSFPDNGVGSITAAQMRSFLNTFLDSVLLSLSTPNIDTPNSLVLNNSFFRLIKSEITSDFFEFYYDPINTVQILGISSSVAGGTVLTIGSDKSLHVNGNIYSN